MKLWCDHPHRNTDFTDFDGAARDSLELNQFFAAILDDTALHQLLGTIHKTDYDRGIELTLAASRLPAIATR
jgi:hypothetical protein